MSLTTWNVHDEVFFHGTRGQVARVGERLLRIHFEDGSKAWVDPDEDAHRLQKPVPCAEVGHRRKRSRQHFQSSEEITVRPAKVAKHFHDSTRKAVKKCRLGASSVHTEAPGDGLHPRSNGSSTANQGQSLPSSKGNLPPHRLILAPMVGGSELAFRLLCRRYGADLCYTPMIYSQRFVQDQEYRKTALYTTRAEPSRDRPLVAHFCGNDPDVLLDAAKLVEKSVDAVDLNLGCPQRVAHSGHFGSYLLGLEDRDLLLRIVRTLAHNLSIPLFCKIRLLDHVQETIELCRQLADNGCRLIAVHARYRGTATRRRDGPAHLDQVREIRDAMAECAPSVPIVSNGNVKSGADVLRNLASTKADGVMSAEGILDDPALFIGCALHASATQTLIESSSRALSRESYKERRKLGKKLRDIERLQQKTERSKEEEEKVSRKIELLQQLEALPSIIDEPGSSLDSLNLLSSGKEVEIPDKLDLALEYLDLAEEYPLDAPLSTVIFHTRRMCRDYLTKYQLLAAIESCSDRDEVRKMLKKCIGYRDGNVKFTSDPRREQAMKKELARKKVERENRKKYEARMERKAKREGKPLDYYLKDKKQSPAQDAAMPSWLDENDES